MSRVIHGCLAGGLLDTLPLHAAIGACELFGAVAAFGRTVNLKKLGDEEWRTAGGAGFDILADGKPGLEVFLEDLRDSYPYSGAATEGPQAVFGRVYQTLEFYRDDKAYDPLRDLVGDFIRTRFPVGPGDVVFGKPVERRILHSVRTLSKETRLHPKRLRKLLGASGLLPEDADGLADGNCLFDAVRGSAAAMEAAAATLSVQKAGLYLNAPRVQRDMLYRAGLIVPRVSGADHGAADQFAPEDLDAFLDRLLDGATPVKAARDGRATIPEAARLACCTSEEIVRLILDGRLSRKWRLFALIRDGVALPRERPRRKDHQEAAVRAVVGELTANPRATALMACGSGKTFVGLWVAQDILESASEARILVLMPSLALVSQTLKAWSLAQPWGGAFHSCCVCSDVSVADGDEIELNPNELPIPVTTQPDEIRRFLTGSGVRTVFSTYQSSERAREAVEGLDGFKFDLAICDEAHRTARAGHSDFTLPLDEELLPIQRRLFMTATRRVFAPKVKKTSVVHSMDDVPLYGQIAYSLNFRQAADLGIICPYKVLISVVTKPELADYIQQTGVRTDGRPRALQEIAGRYALSRAMSRLRLRKAFTFHRTVNSAASFITPGEFGLERFLPDFTCLHVSGAMRTAERETRMVQFKGEDPAIMSNARCLNEGIDVPAVDLVAFMDPKRSMVDIIQAIGRALRKPENSTKAYGYILLPVYIDSEDASDIDTAIKGSEFEDVWYVLRALMAQDLQLTETVEKLRIAQLRNKTSDAADSLSGFLQVIGSADVEDVLRSSIGIQVVEELGEFARLYARDPQPYVAIDGMEAKVRSFLERRFGQGIKINRKRGETVDGLIDFSISCSNSKVYMEKHTFFNAVTPEDRNRRHFVIWSEYSQYGYVIPTAAFDGFLTDDNSTRKPNDKYDWNVLTTYGPHGDFLKFKNELLDVTDYRVDYLEDSQIKLSPLVTVH